MCNAMLVTGCVFQVVLHCFKKNEFLSQEIQFLLPVMLAQSKSLAYVKELCVLGIGQDLVVSPPFVRDCAGSNALLTKGTLC